jgi:hypothetical protein
MMDKIRKGVKHPRLAAKYGVGKISFWKRPFTFPLSSRLPGVNVYELDWDLLIILDSCRTDALHQVAHQDEYSFLDSSGVEAVTSVGSATPEWVTATFRNNHKSEIKHTVYISGNAWPHRILAEGVDITEYYDYAWGPTNWDPVNPGTIGKHIPAWKYSSRSDNNQPQTDASTVRDLTIQAGRKGGYDRTIAHFVEPHYPYPAAARRQGKESDAHRSPLTYLAREGDEEAVWTAYLEELRYGLDNVATLLRNFDAKNVIITADHGDAFGEWWWTGLKSYGHPPAGLHPKVRRVPLVRTTAIDEGTYEPENIDRINDVTAEKNLQYLGYKT